MICVWLLDLETALGGKTGMSDSDAAKDFCTHIGTSASSV